RWGHLCVGPWSEKSKGLPSSWLTWVQVVIEFKRMRRMSRRWAGLGVTGKECESDPRHSLRLRARWWPSLRRKQTRGAPGGGPWKLSLITSRASKGSGVHDSQASHALEFLDIERGHLVSESQSSGRYLQVMWPEESRMREIDPGVPAHTGRIRSGIF